MMSRMGWTPHSAAPTYVNQGTAQLAIGATIALAKPAGLAVGRLMLGMLAIGNSTASPIVTVPSGWLLADSVAWNASSTSLTAIYWKIATSGDVAASTFTWTETNGTATGINGAILQFAGTHQTSPINATANGRQTSGTTGTLLGVTTTVPECLVAQFGNFSYLTPPTGSQWSLAAPAGSTMTGNADQSGFGIAWAAPAFVQVAAGATGTKSVSLSSAASAVNDWEPITIAIAPP